MSAILRLHTPRVSPIGGEEISPPIGSKAHAATKPTVAPLWERALGTVPYPTFQLPIQTKLAINQPGDAFEQEADRVADQVISVHPPHASVHNSLYSRGQPANLGTQKRLATQPGWGVQMITPTLTLGQVAVQRKTQYICTLRIGSKHTSTDKHSNPCAGFSASTYKSFGEPILGQCHLSL
jgi:hypothetical protein